MNDLGHIDFIAVAEYTAAGVQPKLSPAPCEKPGNRYVWTESTAGHHNCYGYLEVLSHVAGEYEFFRGVRDLRVL